MNVRPNFGIGLFQCKSSTTKPFFMNVRKHLISNIKVKDFKKFYVIFTPDTPIFTVQYFRENSEIDTRVRHIVQAETEGWSNF